LAGGEAGAVVKGKEGTPRKTEERRRAEKGLARQVLLTGIKGMDGDDCTPGLGFGTVQRMGSIAGRRCRAFWERGRGTPR